MNGSLESVVARIDERTKNLAENLESCNLAIQQIVKDHEERLRDLEEWQDQRTGEMRAAGIVGGSSGFISGFIAGLIALFSKGGL